jgi:hypothetical protein
LPPGSVLFKESIERSAWDTAHSPYGVTVGNSWDGTRALALLAFGPEDPRAWAALARSARAFSDSATDAEEILPGSRLIQLSVATSLAAGTLEAFERIGRQRFPAEELAFADQTFSELRLMTFHGGYGKLAPPPARSVAEALELVAENLAPVKFKRRQDALEEGVRLSAEELRRELARAESPQGPGPGSREALALRSRLGQELWDSGNWESAKEAKDLAREASLGLDRLLGPEAPEARAAKERLARLLVGLHGHGSFPILYPDNILSRVELKAGVALFRELEKIAPKSDEEARSRAATLAAAADLVGKEGDWKPLARLKPQRSSKRADETRHSDEDNIARSRLDNDLALLALMAGQRDVSLEFASNARASQGIEVNARHPESGRALALLGILYDEDLGSDEYLSLALETVAGRGGRFAPFEADLKFRLGMSFAARNDFGPATAILGEADELLRASWGDMSQKRLERAAWRALILFLAESYDDSLKLCQSLVQLLDGAPPRRDPDPDSPPDETILATALVVGGSALLVRGEREEGERLIVRASALRDLRREESVLGKIADQLAAAHAESERSGQDSAALRDAIKVSLSRPADDEDAR